MAPAGCPDRETLAALAAGRLSGEALAAVAAHLDGCPACLALAQAATTDTDPLVAALCRPDPADPYAREAGCDRAEARLRAPAESGAASDLPTARGLRPGSRSRARRPARPPASCVIGRCACTPAAAWARSTSPSTRSCRGRWPSSGSGGPTPTTRRAAGGSSRRRRSPRAWSTPASCRSTASARDADGRPYYAMRFIQGETSRRRIDRFHADEAARAATRAGGRLALRRPAAAGSSTCATRSPTPTAGGCCTATSSRPTSCSAAYGETLVVDWGLAKAVGPASRRRRRRPSGRWWPASASGVGRDAARPGAGDAGVHEPRAGPGRPRRARPAPATSTAWGRPSTAC